MKKILFFDDEPHVSRYLINSLNQIIKDKSYEWEIIFISNVKELLDEINGLTTTYDLFVLDVMVPLPSGETKNLFTKTELKKMDKGMSTGLVLAEKIRSHERYNRTPILYLSAKQAPSIPETEKTYTAYIRKPESPDNIAKKINELLYKKNK